jgi:acetyl-CoA synthetase
VSELYPVPDNIKARTLMDEATYQRLYNQSVDDPDSFWAEQASNFLSWEKSWHTVSQADLPRAMSLGLRAPN